MSKQSICGKVNKGKRVTFACARRRNRRMVASGSCWSILLMYSSPPIWFSCKHLQVAPLLKNHTLNILSPEPNFRFALFAVWGFATACRHGEAELQAAFKMTVDRTTSSMSSAMACLLDVVRNVLFAQMTDQLHLLPCHAALLLAPYNSASISPPLSSRASLLRSGLWPEVCIGRPGCIGGETIQQTLQALVL